MSLFFEDVEIKNESTPEASVVVEDVSGLLSVTLESEMTWHNLETSVMKEEFQAVMNEDQLRLEGSKETMFQKIIKFFDGLWKKLVTVIQNIITRLQTSFVNGTKFIAKRSDAIKKYTGGRSATVFEWSSQSQTVAQISGTFKKDLAGQLVKAVKTASTSGQAKSADELAKDLGFDGMSGMDAKLLSIGHGPARKSVVVSKEMLNKAVSDVEGAKVAISALKELANQARTMVATGKKEATDGLKAVKEKSEQLQKQKTASSSTARAATTVINKYINVYIKLAMDRFGDSLRMVQSAVGGVKADDKATAQKAKADAKAEKGKAKEAEAKTDDTKKEDFDLFGLTLEDFEDEAIEEDVVEEDLDLDSFSLEDLELEEDVETEELEEGLEFDFEF